MLVYQMTNVKGRFPWYLRNLTGCPAARFEVHGNLNECGVGSAVCSIAIFFRELWTVNVGLCLISVDMDRGWPQRLHDSKRDKGKGEILVLRKLPKRDFRTDVQDLYQLIHQGRAWGHGPMLYNALFSKEWPGCMVCWLTFVSVQQGSSICMYTNKYRCCL